MTDREDCPPIALRPEDHLFRTTFTSRFEVEEERQAILILVRMLCEYLNEVHAWGNGTDTVAGKLEAVATDLHETANYLAMVGEERREFHLAPEENRLSLRADRWAMELLTLAETIRREIRPEDRPVEPVH